MPTVVVTAVFQPLPERKDALVQALRQSMPAVHDEQGCQLYAIHDAADGTITMIEKWDSANDLAAHGSGPAVAALRQACEEFLAGPAVVTTMTPIPVGVKGEL